MLCVQVWPGRPQPAAGAGMSSFRNFGGEFRREQRVSLAGRSRVEETRAEVLERTRRERERRRQEKLEQKSATRIQARWAGGRAGGWQRVPPSNTSRRFCMCWLAGRQPGLMRPSLVLLLMLQAAWRGWCARQRHQAGVRQEWQARFGQHGEHASR